MPSATDLTFMVLVPYSNAKSSVKRNYAYSKRKHIFYVTTCIIWKPQSAQGEAIIRCFPSRFVIVPTLRFMLPQCYLKKYVS